MTPEDTHWPLRLTTDSGQEYNVYPADLEQWQIMATSAEGMLVGRYQGKNYHIRIVMQDGRDVHLVVDGLPMKVSLKRPVDLQIEQMSPSVRRSQDLAPLVAPLPGVIVRLHATEGDHLAEGDAALTIEAMKMENVVRMRERSQVVRVYVKPGDTVAKGQLLMETKPSE